MEIRFLEPRDVQAYRPLRLEALREAPTAFASSDDQEAARPISEFLAKLRPHDDPASGVFGAFDDAQLLVGILGFTREGREKRIHVSSLSSMYVTPERRRSGIARLLTLKAIDHARRLPGTRQVLLTVTRNNVAARNLYLSLCFVPFGLEPDALRVDEEYFDQEHLILKLI